MTALALLDADGNEVLSPVGTAILGADGGDCSCSSAVACMTMCAYGELLGNQIAGVYPAPLGADAKSWGTDGYGDIWVHCLDGNWVLDEVWTYWSPQFTLSAGAGGWPPFMLVGSASTPPDADQAIWCWNLAGGIGRGNVAEGWVPTTAITGVLSGLPAQLAGANGLTFVLSLSLSGWSGTVSGPWTGYRLFIQSFGAGSNGQFWRATLDYHNPSPPYNEATLDWFFTAWSAANPLGTYSGQILWNGGAPGTPPVLSAMTLVLS